MANQSINRYFLITKRNFFTLFLFFCFSFFFVLQDASAWSLYNNSNASASAGTRYTPTRIKTPTKKVTPKVTFKITPIKTKTPIRRITPTISVSYTAKCEKEVDKNGNFTGYYKKALIGDSCDDETGEFICEAPKGIIVDSETGVAICDECPEGTVRVDEVVLNDGNVTYNYNGHCLCGTSTRYGNMPTDNMYYECRETKDGKLESGAECCHNGGQKHCSESGMVYDKFLQVCVCPSKTNKKTKKFEQQLLVINSDGSKSCVESCDEKSGLIAAEGREYQVKQCKCKEENKVIVDGKCQTCEEAIAGSIFNNGVCECDKSINYYAGYCEDVEGKAKSLFGVPCCRYCNGKIQEDGSCKECGQNERWSKGECLPCPKNSIKDDKVGCKCPAGTGTTPSNRNECVCLKEHAVIVNGKCVCGYGYRENGDVCEECPKNSVYEGNECKCPKDAQETYNLLTHKAFCECTDPNSILKEYMDGTKSCVCKSGYKKIGNTCKCDKDKGLVEKNGKCQCEDPNKEPNKDGICDCKKDSLYCKRNGKCLKPKGVSRDENGNCECPAGADFVKSSEDVGEAECKCIGDYAKMKIDDNGRYYCGCEPTFIGDAGGCFCDFRATQVGNKCVCDDKNASPNDKGYCTCNSDYKLKNGKCVKSCGILYETCGNVCCHKPENTCDENNKKCICNEKKSYYNIDGKCEKCSKEKLCGLKCCSKGEVCYNNKDCVCDSDKKYYRDMKGGCTQCKGDLCEGNCCRNDQQCVEYQDPNSYTITNGYETHKKCTCKSGGPDCGGKCCKSGEECNIGKNKCYKPKPCKTKDGSWGEIKEGVCTVTDILNDAKNMEPIRVLD